MRNLSLLLDDDPRPARRQISEFPPARAQVTEYRQHTLNCPHCGASNRAGWPEEVPSGCFGSRAQAVIGYLTGRLGLSHRTVVIFAGIALVLTLAATWYARSQRQEAKSRDQAVTRHEQQTLRGHETIVESIAFSPDAKTLVSAGSGGKIKLWEVATGQNLITLNGHESDVFSLAISPDGKTLASAGADKTVKLWEMASRQNFAILKGHQSDITSIAISPSSKTF